MIRHSFSYRSFVLAVALFLIIPALPARAQNTGMLKGTVVDAQNNPVDGAKIHIEFADGMNRKYDTKTNKKGEFIQIGLQTGNYNVTAEKEKVGSQTLSVRVTLGGAAQLNFQLTPQSGANRPLTKEEAAKLMAFKTAFEAGVAATNAGNYDEAVAKFQEALTTQPDCYACQFNVGGAYTQRAAKAADEAARKEDYAKAEEAFQKAMQMKPDSAEPYNALANIYNAQKRFDEAAKMTEEATKRAGSGADAAGGNPDQLFNQGVIFWNAGKTMEAKKQFEAALAMKPDLAEAHYWVGMAHLNEGKIPDAVEHFEEYLKLAPNGQYADQAKGVLSQIKKL